MMVPYRARLYACAAILASVAAFGELAPAQAQGSQACKYYQDAVTSGAVISDKVLASDWQTAVRCLALILDDHKSSLERSPKSVSWAQFVRATGALRLVIANNEKAGAGVNSAVQGFRTVATLDSISSLAFGARSDDDNARLNATLVLGNVIDNQFVCVPIDHLYDPQIAATPYGVKGRANLLAVVSVVAPWAYKENYEKILALHDDIAKALGPARGNADLSQTFQILDNIKSRLAFQDKPGSSKESSIPSDLRACAHYRPKWAGVKLQYVFP